VKRCRVDGESQGRDGRSSMVQSTATSPLGSPWTGMVGVAAARVSRVLAAYTPRPRGRGSGTVGGPDLERHHRES